MKRSIIIIGLLIICTLSGCTTKAAPKGMSAEETVKYYFSQYSNKNQSGMDALVYKTKRGADFDLGNLNYVKLISFKEETDTTKFNYQNDWYENPYKIALVNVTFDINYKEGGTGGGLSNGIYNCHYYLVKENEKSDWIIVMWGNADP